jgi:hypothetical protein
MDQTLRRKQSFLLRLPTTLREHAAEIAHNEGTSLNHFISLAVAEKISRMEQELADHSPRTIQGFKSSPGHLH